MRETGFYWVVWCKSEQVAFWNQSSEGWYIADNQGKMCDSDLEEIDERRIVREVE